MLRWSVFALIVGALVMVRKGRHLVDSSRRRKQIPNMSNLDAYKEDIVGYLDALGSSDALGPLTYITNLMQNEQSRFWNRFYSLTALHAGLFIVAVTVKGKWVTLATAVIGLGVAILWMKIHTRSRDYAERWKPAFDGYRQVHGIWWFRETDETKPRWPSTRLAGMVPKVLLAAWSLLGIYAICGPF